MFHTAPGPDLGGHIRRRFLLPKGNWDEVAKISIEDSNGGIRPENQDDYRARSFIASRLEGSEGTSSVINVKDLGFSAAHQLFYGLSERESLEDAMEAAEIRGLLGLEAKSSATIKESIREEIKLRLESASEEGEICGENANLHTAFASCVTRRRILGILLYMKKLEYFEKFVRENITDDDLPLEPTRSAYEPSTLTRASKENTTLFEDWEDNDVVLFYSHQSLFFVPFFDIRDNRLCSYTLGQNMRLPWRKYELKSSSGNGVVYQVEIHPSHHNFKPVRLFNKPHYFALKEIDTHDEDIYHQELVALEKTCAQIQKDSHLIKLLLTFQHGRKYYFLFEWADGNLGEYWHEHPYGPERTIEKMRWAATQCLGLATAVKRIHGLATWQKERRNQPQMLGISGREDENEWGRHGDIKPNNILWFASDGDRFVLSDLGLTRFHSSVTRSLVPHTSIAGYSWSYRAPEMDNPQQNICQKYDIWSLGCVFLEFCSWWLLGLKGVEEFWNVRVKGSQISVVDEDNYFTMTQSRKHFEAIVKPSVTEVRLKKLS
ncbi:kinase-like domain-containing protein [Nemania diffusa]|nr:kinase-like domain-containing protein [Nemania diffusa]